LVALGPARCTFDASAWHAGCSWAATPMTDLIILVFTIGCYGATVGFMRFCDRI
jgi:hypothetical protein